MSFRAANLYALILTPFLSTIILIPYILRLLRPDVFLVLPSIKQLLLLMVAFLVGVILHELLHAIGWMTAGRVEWHDIKFGVKSMTPYTHCKVPVSASVYRFSVLLPGIVLGLIPGWIGCMVNSFWWVVFGIAMFTSAAGDLMIIWLLRDLPSTAQILDHPSKMGCQVIYR